MSRGVVLHIIETLGRGGAETCLAAGLPALRALGWDARVVPLASPYDVRADLEAAGVPVIAHDGPLRFASLAVRLAQLRPVLVHTHLFRANVLGRLLGWTLRVPVVSTLHNPDYGAEGTGFLGLRHGVDRATMRLAGPRLLAVSRVVVDDYRKHMGVESGVLPNPIGRSWFEKGPTRDGARKALGVEGNRALVFTAGRLHRQKGFDTLAAAAAAVRTASFVVAGRGPERSALERHPALRLLGAIPPEEMRLWLAAADVVAIPSRYESFGVFAAEALASGRAIVATDIDGLRDTVGDAAVLVPAEHPAALAQAIEGLLSNVPRREELEHRGPAQAAQFTPERWASRLDAIYQSIAQARG